uniref:ClpX-type ZB domain-containing protein n=1 Tax=Romanomermis culicivorax TaxID=13658 RepID=A0A915I342_ROMCU
MRKHFILTTVRNVGQISTLRRLSGLDLAKCANFHQNSRSYHRLRHHKSLERCAFDDFHHNLKDVEVFWASPTEDNPTAVRGCPSGGGNNGGGGDFATYDLNGVKRLFETGGGGRGGGGSGNMGGGQSPLTCPSCGNVCSRVDTFILSTRFLQCEQCRILLHVIAETTSARSYANSAASVYSQTVKKQFPTPKKIKEYLDRYVIGQDEAKKVLSVAVYNHYKRIATCPVLPNQQSKPPTPPGMFPDSNITESMLSEVAKKHMQFFGAPPQTPKNVDFFRQQQTLNEQQQQTFQQSRTTSDIINSDRTDLKLDKSNILMLGPTGCGKTLLAQTIAQCLDVPFAICDCTSLTQAGYVGEDVESVIARLLQNANFDVERAQNGIIFLDEVDKISAVPGVQQLRDVGGEGALLKMLEGTLVNVQQSGSRRLRNETVPVDTTNILFVASGAFNGLDKIVGKRKNDKVLGFGLSSRKNSLDGKSLNKASSPYLDDESMEDIHERDILTSEADPQDMIQFGMLPEFVGRFPVLVPFHSLTEDMLVQILTEPKNALVKQYKKLFELDEIELHFNDDALQAIAGLALKRKTGARGLRSIVEKILLNAMFETPGSDVCAITVTADAIVNKAELEYSKRMNDFGEKVAAL